MVEFEKKFTVKDFKELNKYHSGNKKIIIIIISLVMIILGLLCFLLKLNDLGLFMLLFGIIYPFVFIIIIKLNQKALTKNLTFIDVVQNYQFFEDKVFVNETKGEDFQSYTKMSYNQILKVVETPTSYLIYQSENQAHVIYKENLIKGSLDELNAYFAINLKSKFIIKK